MANNIREYRRRIKSVRNTAQLTRAMKMVSAAKLRRAQDRMLAARPYAAALRRALAEVARRADPSFHPLLVQRPEERIDLLVITSDKGLCGAFNVNILKAAEAFRREKAAAGVDVQLTLIGRKGIEYFKVRPDVPIRARYPEISREIGPGLARKFAEEEEARFVGGETDAVYVAYNGFKSAISQKVTVEPLFPLANLALEEEGELRREGVDFLYEPGPRELLDRLLSRYAGFQLYHALLESSAAEHAARMAAMDNATRNAEEMIDKLTLVMNRIRQASITTEIIEVVSGAQALD